MADISNVELSSVETWQLGSSCSESAGNESGLTTKTSCDERKVAPGVAPIKKEYLKKLHQSSIKDTVQNNPEGVTHNREIDSKNDDDRKAGEEGEPPAKRKKKRGMNKNRPRAAKLDLGSQLCPSVVKDVKCDYGENCRFSHDITEYLASKAPDIGDDCINFIKFGKCNYGITCRFGKKHVSADLKNIVNTELSEDTASSRPQNVLSKELMHALRKKTYKFPKTEVYLKQLTLVKNEGKPFSELGSLPKPWINNAGAVTDEDVIKLRPEERKKINFADKLYLAPLTTVGNLPFRRICKQYGADVTCSEMAMCTKLLQASKSEWALLKRHPSEDIFGAQLCGSFPDTMTKCAELLENETSVDFVDINIGCPIDLVFNQGAGCALMGRQGKFEQIIRGMNYVLDMPLTVKMRTGISDKKKSWNAHKIITALRDWDVSLVTLHGRSREQRYSRKADWEYINECATAAAPMPLFGNGDVLSYEDAMFRKEQTGVSGLMIARGALIKPWIFTEIKEHRHWDISSSERFDMLKEFVNFGLEHWGSDTMGVENTRRFLLEWLSFQCREYCTALWILERCLSDSRETKPKQPLWSIKIEAHSKMSQSEIEVQKNGYIPVGLLERLPQQINERPPPYYGRNDLETLLSSSNSADWVKVSEMLLGPVPSGFSFLPKHKANSYAEPEG